MPNWVVIFSNVNMDFPDHFHNNLLPALNHVADEMNIEVLAQLPIQPDIAELCDAGKIEQKDISFLNEAVEKLIQKINL